MNIRIENESGIDTIETEDFSSDSWNGVYEYVQQILEMSGTVEKFSPPEGSSDWNGQQWLEYAYSL